jgi:hypothetical protein
LLPSNLSREHDVNDEYGGLFPGLQVRSYHLLSTLAQRWKYKNFLLPQIQNQWILSGLSLTRRDLVKPTSQEWSTINPTSRKQETQVMQRKSAQSGLNFNLSNKECMVADRAWLPRTIASIRMLHGRNEEAFRPRWRPLVKPFPSDPCQH